MSNPPTPREDGCAPIPFEYTGYRRGSAIPYQAFVLGTPSVSATHDGDLAFHQVNGEDGSGEVVSFYDLKHRTRCVQAGTPAGSICSPEYVTWNGSALDGFFIDGVDCGTLVAAPSYCEEVQPARAYAIGEPVASSEFPSLHESQVVVGGLVLSLWTSTHGTLALPREALHLDGASGLDSGCQLALAADEAVRCLPGKASPRCSTFLTRHAPAARGHLLQRLGRIAESSTALNTAVRLTVDPATRAFLERQAQSTRGAT